jgi:hypothetical protein
VHFFHFSLLSLAPPLAPQGSGSRIPPSSARSTLGSYRLSLPTIFQGSSGGLWSSSNGPLSPPMCSVGFSSLTQAPSSAPMGSGWWSSGDWGYSKVFLSRHHLRSGLISESLNAIQIIITLRHRFPEQEDKYTGQVRRPPQSPSGSTLRILIPASRHPGLQQMPKGFTSDRTYCKGN